MTLLCITLSPEGIDLASDLKCMVSTNIKMEDFVILNLGCTVGHDTIIKKYSAFLPSVNIS